MVGGSTKVPLVYNKVKEVFCSGIAGRPRARCDEPIIDEPDISVALGAAIRATTYGLNMYDGRKRILVNLRNPGGTDRSTYTVSGKVQVLDPSIDLNNANLHVTAREGGFREEKRLDDNGNFSFRNIPLQENTISNFVLTIVDSRGQEVAVFGRSVAQNQEYRSTGTGLTNPAVLSRPICLEVLDGGKSINQVLLEVGASLPADGHFTFYTTDQSGMLRMPLYEENMVIKTIEIPVDTSLPEGTPVEFYIQCDEKRYINAEGEVAGQRFAARVEPPPPPSPPTKQDYEQLLNHFKEALGYLSEGQKMKFRARKKKISADIEEAFQVSETPKLLQRMAELDGLIKEIEEGREQPLEPLKQYFDALVQECLRLAKIARQHLERFDCSEWKANIETQRQFGEEAYRAKDQLKYGECHAQLVSYYRYLFEELKKKGTIRVPTDEERAYQLVQDLRGWLEELEKTARGMKRDDLVKELKKQDGLLKALEPLCTSTPSKVLREGQAMQTELQKIYQEFESMLRPGQRDRLRGLVRTGTM